MDAWPQSFLCDYLLYPLSPLGTVHTYNTTSIIVCILGHIYHNLILFHIVYLPPKNNIYLLVMDRVPETRVLEVQWRNGYKAS